MFAFKSDEDKLRHSMHLVEAKIQGEKRKWAATNQQSWDQATPFIYKYHKEADAQLHQQR